MKTFNNAKYFNINLTNQAYHDIFNAVTTELTEATDKFPPFRSGHEGFAILLEEVDELWETVREKQSSKERPANMKAEAIQVAAMALRFIHDCCQEVND